MRSRSNLESSNYENDSEFSIKCNSNSSIHNCQLRNVYVGHCVVFLSSPQVENKNEEGVGILFKTLFEQLDLTLK